MPSTHLSLHYHIAFSTKERRPFIVPTWRERLHAYLGGIVRNLGGVAEAVGGVDDHVHLLIGLRATHCLADVAPTQAEMQDIAAWCETLRAALVR